MSCPNTGPIVIVGSDLERLREEFVRRIAEPLLLNFLRATGVPESVIAGASVGYNYAAAVTDQYQYGGKRP